MEENKGSLFEKFFSVDEFKISALVVVLFIDVIAILVWLFLHGTIPSALIELALGLIYSIAGVNVFNGVTNAISGRYNTTNSITNQSNKSNMP